MDFHRNHSLNNHSPSPSSSTSSTTTAPNPSATTTTTATTTADTDPMHSWWESVSKARTRIHSLSSLLSDSLSLSSLADSDRPALSLLSSHDAYSAVSSSLSGSLSGSGSDPLCNWFYDTFLSGDPNLRLVVLSFLPLLSSLYLSRIHSASSDSPSLPSLAGFEAVLLAIYSSEVKSRNGKPILVSIPDLSVPSLYHSPRTYNNKPNSGQGKLRNSVGVLSPVLEPQNAVKSTKRACIVGVAFDCYYKQIAQMPSWSKLEFCRSAAGWAGRDCCCGREFDKDEGFGIREVLEYGDEIEGEFGRLGIGENGDGLGDGQSKGVRIPLPWELLQPVLRILGHCLLAPLNLQDVKDAASVAVRCLYARATHDLVPQVILATRSLIQLDNRNRAAAKALAATNASSNANTPSKDKKPEILLVSK